MNTKISCVSVVIVWLACSVLSRAEMPAYVVTDLGTLGGADSEAAGLNDSGQVTGDSDTAGDSASHAFVYSSGSMTDLGTLGGAGSLGYGLNDSGQVTGVAVSGNGVGHAFLYSNGSMIDLGTLGGTSSGGTGINGSGQVTGDSDTAGDSAYHAFVYSDGSMTDLGTLGGTDSIGYGINNSGQVTGWSYTSGGAQHAFLYSGGSMTDLGTLGGIFSIGYGINNSGQVTGNSVLSDNRGYCAFLYSGGTMYDLNNLVSVSQGVTNISIDLGLGNHINDLGQIAADGIVNGQTHALLLTPRAMGTQFSGGVGDLPGGASVSVVNAVANGGAVAAGFGNNANGQDAATWTLNGGLVGANLNNSGQYPSSVANAISADGSVEVGIHGATLHAFRMNTSTGVVTDLQNLVGQSDGVGNGVSADGNYATGWSGQPDGSVQLAVRWDANGNATNLGTLPGGTHSFGFALSGDGSEVVGGSEYGNGSNTEAMRWTQAGGMQGIGFLAGGSTSFARAVSSDGSTIVGQSQMTGGNQAFRWTSSGGMVGLGNFSGGTADSGAFGASSDGGVIVGYGHDAGGMKAFVWDQAHGLQNLQTVLSTEYGIDFTGWTLLNTTSVSADATAVGGYGYDPSGNVQGFVAQINSRTYRFVSGDDYNTFQTEHLGGFGTNMALLDGTAGGAEGSYRTVTTKMLNDSSVSVVPPRGFASDIANVTGMSGDTFVLQLSVDPATAASLLGGISNSRLDWLNPNTDVWQNAVDGNTGGIAQFVNGAYDPLTDFQLGDYGVDTTTDTVWAVVNHDSDFAVSDVNATATPEPGTWAMLLTGALAGAVLRRENRKEKHSKRN